MIDLSIIIPCYNEANRIKSTLCSIRDYCKTRNLEVEIIIVDDGSNDNTLEKINKLDMDILIRVISFFKNQGKGAAVKRGMLEASGRLVLFTDADLSTPIEEYEKLERAIKCENYDIAIGSRGLPESKKVVAQNFFRDKMGKLFGKLVSFLLLPDIKDSQCGFKLFKKNIIKDIFIWQTILGFGFDPEILLIAKKQDFKIKEIPVLWRNSFESKLSPFRDTFFIGFELFKVKVKDILGHYSL